MNYLKALILILFFQTAAVGQSKVPDEMVEFRNVWVFSNDENAMKFNVDDTDMKLFFKAVFNRDSIMGFYIILNYSCPCTPALDRANEVRYSSDTGNELFYKADYIYSEFSFESPKKKLKTKNIPVELRVNKVDGQAILTIDNTTVTKQRSNFTSISINSGLLKNGTMHPSASSIR